ncbi:MAG: RDD family protein [Chloroflexi bacterium]|nr:RDD family protein [Chloroflexota bacterium]
MDDIQPFQPEIEPIPQVQEEEVEEKKGRPVCGFWIRLLAFIIDIILLGIFGLILGLFWGEFFARIGVWGRLVGFLITLAYFGILNSCRGKGRTIGKMITRIRVVDKDGCCISIERSLLRAAILFLPVFLNKLSLPPVLLISPAGKIISLLLVLIVFGLGGGIVFFYIFNGRTRQSIHDLICGTFVVKAKSEGPVEAGQVSRALYTVYGIFLVVLLVISISAPFIVNKFIGKDKIYKLSAIYKSLSELNNISSATMMEGKFYQAVYGNKGQQTRAMNYIRVDAILKEKPASYEAEIQKIARFILENYPDSNNTDVLQVSVSYGYDIGISSVYTSYLQNQSPDEWRTSGENQYPSGTGGFRKLTTKIFSF